MIIYMMQHGVALDVSQDVDEGLSLIGEESIAMSAKGLKKIGIFFDALIASPKKRSLQTAQIIARELDFPKEEILITDDAKPAGRALDLLHYIERLGVGSVFIAGHLPNLVETSSFLLSDRGKVKIGIVNGSCMRIDTDDLFSHEGVLKWYLTPAQLKMIYE